MTQEKGTEAAFTGKYLNHHENGMYTCKVCNAPLFSSSTKFDSKTGWPSFIAPIDEKNVVRISDTSHGMNRVEVQCKNCGAHLGHVFSDGPEKMPNGSKATGERFCINSCSLNFTKNA